MRIKGATEFDKLCHKVYSGKSNGLDYHIRRTGISCSSCGSELGVYYCEELLYLVECRKCRKKALIEAGSPASAAYKTFAHEGGDHE